ncbi:transmembrane protein 35A-like [Mizuhopecten yessoensis]|uniref:Novel acetylcholine receptor chaperone n=1 Tax=Mizuhopecten yessoensis TaxID=6573 RepID=A0A210PUQ0_MIZYE|nr:transmembrane protein 35A-like [Mizuhopecten yessoensis]OWF40182.1 Transmembrane protein 35 [Mizuhopecten yessoensis]
MASFVLRVLSLTLGIFFIFIGTLKLSPSINDELYRQMRRSFIKSANVFPLWKLTGWRPSPHMYRKMFGGTEIICGVILVAIPGPLKDVVNVVMLLMMLLDVYTHWALDEGLDKMSLSIVFLLLLTCRLIVYLQVKLRNMEEAKDEKKNKMEETAAKTATQVKKDQ